MGAVAAALVLMIPAYRHFASPIPLLWVGGRDGILALRQDNGRVAVEISCEAPVDAIAVDAQSEVVWAACGNAGLRSYTIAGDFRLARRFAGPSAAPVLLALDPRLRRIWLGSGRTLWLFDSSGTVLEQTDTEGPLLATALDSRRSRLWAITAKFLTVYEPAGAPILAIDTAGLGALHALEYDPGLDRIWVVGTKGWAHCRPDGSLDHCRQTAQFADVSLLASGGEGSIWGASPTRLLRLRSDGAVALALEPFDTSAGERILSLAADPAGRTAWVASDRRIAGYRADGARVARFAPAVRGRSPRLALPPPPTPPELQLTVPAERGGAFPLLQLKYAATDDDSASLRITANGKRLDTVCETGAGNTRSVRALASAR